MKGKNISIGVIGAVRKAMDPKKAERVKETLVYLKHKELKDKEYANFQENYMFVDDFEELPHMYDIAFRHKKLRLIPRRGLGISPPINIDHDLHHSSERRAKNIWRNRRPGLGISPPETIDYDVHHSSESVDEELFVGDPEELPHMYDIAFRHNKLRLKPRRGLGISPPPENIDHDVHHSSERRAKNIWRNHRPGLGISPPETIDHDVHHSSESVDEDLFVDDPEELPHMYDIAFFRHEKFRLIPRRGLGISPPETIDHDESVDDKCDQELNKNKNSA